MEIGVNVENAMSHGVPPPPPPDVGAGAGAPRPRPRPRPRPAPPPAPTPRTRPRTRPHPHAPQKGSKKSQKRVKIKYFFPRCRAIFWGAGRPLRGAPVSGKVSGKPPPQEGGG